MSISIEQDTDNVWQIRITGQLKKAELDAAQEKVADNIAKVGTIKTLVILEDFEGWESGANWGDMRFFFAHGDDVDKIAIVGDPRWEDDALMFVGAGLRRAPVKFFPESQLTEARTWLE